MGNIRFYGFFWKVFHWFPTLLPQLATVASWDRTVLAVLWDTLPFSAIARPSLSSMHSMAIITARLVRVDSEYM